eukprot:4117057-Lingulodinium_polyedra.AAC.1
MPKHDPGAPTPTPAEAPAGPTPADAAQTVPGGDAGPVTADVKVEQPGDVNPKSPSFAGLHCMAQHSLDEGVAVATRGFA